jgi:hypothetical protein
VFGEFNGGVQSGVSEFNRAFVSLIACLMSVIM